MKLRARAGVARHHRGDRSAVVGLRDQAIAVRGPQVIGVHEIAVQAVGPERDAREQRVAYLLFHCHLSSREIFCVTPQQFRDVQEISHLRARILGRILLHSDLVP